MSWPNIRSKWAPGDDVKEVLDDAVGDEHLPALVPVEAPGVRRAVGVGLERRAASDDSATRRS